MPEQQPQKQQQESNTFSFLVRILLSGGVFFIVYSLLSLFFSPPGSGNQTNVDNYLKPSFAKGEKMNLYWFVGESCKVQSFGELNLIWNVTDLTLDWNKANTQDYNYTLSVDKNLANNGTVCLHAFLTKSFLSPTLNRSDDQIHLTKNLVHYRPLKIDKRKFLVGSNSNEEIKPESTEEKIVSYMDPNNELRIIVDPVMPNPELLPRIMREFRINPKTRKFLPLTFFNTFWSFEDNYVLINQTVNDTIPDQNITLSLHFSPISLTKWNFIVCLEMAFEIQVEMLGKAAADELTEMKRIIKETNPYLLGITVIVSTLHSILEFLSFKNEVSFWRTRRSLAGLSIRTVFTTTICHFIVFLSLCNHETSYLIILSAGVGVLIDLWKITKVVNVKVIRLSNGLPWLSVTDKTTYSRNTKRIDQTAMKYMSYCLFPLVLIYGIYSLIYHPQKNWYSWVLSTLTNDVYMFGFILMTPQLFINYKLKSVSHLPWRALLYRTVNTFIDDLFAFVIKMPMAHRIACFRDDIVFLIYCYQRWIYPVDTSRKEALDWEENNEEGNDGNEEKEKEESKKNDTETQNLKDKKQK